MTEPINSYAAKTAAQPAQTPNPEPVARGRQAGPHAALLALQHGAGNQAVSQLLQAALSGSGQPLDPTTQTFMEERFGHDFDQVRVHTDDRATASAEAVAAQAYTVGQDVVFGQGHYAPATSEGRQLLAHELAHVVQQSRGGSSAPSLSPSSPLEQAADQAVSTFSQGSGLVQVSGASAPGLARMTIKEAESKLGRFVPDFVKKHAQPTVELLHTVVDPNAELPKPVEAIVDRAEAAAAVVLPSAPSEAQPPTPKASDPPASQKKHAQLALKEGDVKKAVSGMTSVTEDLKGLARDKLLGGLGTVKGVVTQVTEVADTALWVGGEYKSLRSKAAKAIGGKEGSTTNQLVSGLIDATVSVLPGTGTLNLKALADANEQAKAAGLVDKQTGQASLTAPMSDKLNEAGKWTENKVGGTPADPSLFTPMEQAELEAAIGTQVALAFTGAEEVKVAMNVIGAMSGLRGVVDSRRGNPDGWYKDTTFWSNLIGMGLSSAGLKHTMAAGKISTIMLKFGWGAAAIPPLTQMAADYANTEISEEERDKRMKRNWVQAMHVLKDAVLHVVQAQRAKTTNNEGESSARQPQKFGAGTMADAEPVAPPIAAPNLDVPSAQQAAKPTTGSNQRTQPSPVKSGGPEPQAASAGPKPPQKLAMDAMKRLDEPQPFKLHVSDKRAAQIRIGEKNFALDRALTFDVDEVLPVGAADIKPQRAVTRARDPYNRHLLDPNTNQRSKGLGIDSRELRANRGEYDAVSVRDNPNALITRRFSEVHELKRIFDQAVASVKEPQKLSPTQLKARINEETRRIITEDTGPDAVAVREALAALGFEREPGRGYVGMKEPPSKSSNETPQAQMRVAAEAADDTHAAEVAAIRKRQAEREVARMRAAEEREAEMQSKEDLESQPENKKRLKREQ